MKKALKISYKTTVILSLLAVLFISLGYLLFQQGSREGLDTDSSTVTVAPTVTVAQTAADTSTVPALYDGTISSSGPSIPVLNNLPLKEDTAYNGMPKADAYVRPDFVNSQLNVFNNKFKEDVNAAMTELKNVKTFLASKKINRTTQIDNVEKQIQVIYKRLNYLASSLDALYVSPNFKSLSPNIKSIQTMLKSNGYAKDTPMLNEISTGLDKLIKEGNTPISWFPGRGGNQPNELEPVGAQPVGAEQTDLLQTKVSPLPTGSALVDELQNNAYNQLPAAN